MKIVTRKRSDDDLDSYDWRDAFEIQLTTDNSTVLMSFYDGEPEDANMSRDFNDVFSIKDALVAAYEAGKRGEPLETEIEDLKE